MAKLIKEPFRYDIVGSFLRPQILKDVKNKYEEGILTLETVESFEDIEIRNLIEDELQHGLPSLTDGEFRRKYWNLDFMWGFDNVVHSMHKIGYIFQGDVTRADGIKLTGKLGYTTHPFIKHFEFLKNNVGPFSNHPRLSIPSPSQFYMELLRDEDNVNEIYSNRDELINDLKNIYIKFIKHVNSIGCDTIQLDDCSWGLLIDNNYSVIVLKNYTLDKLANTFVDLNNSVIDYFKDSNINFTTHVCKGNYRSKYAFSGGYAKISKYLFKEHVNGFYLEFDDERSGDFLPLLDCPKDKYIALGLITTKSPILENKEFIKKRILEASKYHPLEYLCLSTQCGFSSTEEGNLLTIEEQWKKIDLVKEIAKEVWKD